MQVGQQSRRLIVLWVVVVVVTALGAAAGWVGGTLRPIQYTSESLFIWDPASLRYGDSTAYVPDSVSLGSQVEGQVLRILSDSVIDPASKKLGMTTRDIRAALDVSVGSGTSSIIVATVATTPDKALQINQAVTEEYVSQSNATFSAQYEAQAEALQTSIDAVTEQLSKTADTLPLANSLATQLTALVSQQQILQAKATAAPTPLKQLRQPTLPTDPSSLSPLTLAIVGGALGFLIGLAILVLVTLRRSSAVRRP